MTKLLTELFLHLRAKFTGVPVKQLKEAQRLLALYRRGRYYRLLGLQEGAPATQVAAAVSKLRQRLGAYPGVHACLEDVFAVLNPPRRRKFYRAARAIFREVVQQCPERTREKIADRLWPTYWSWIRKEYKESPEAITSHKGDIVRWLKSGI